jgi:hypothetical protein
LDRVDPLLSLPWTTGVRGEALTAYINALWESYSLNVISAIMLFKHEAYKNEKEYRFQQLIGRSGPAAVVKYRPRARRWCVTGNSTGGKTPPARSERSSSGRRPSEAKQHGL